jgi:hypothetical protein
MAAPANIGFDPLYVKYGAPEIVNSVAGLPSNYASFIMSAYLPLWFDLTWLGDLSTDPISNKRMEAVVTYGDTDIVLGTQVKTAISVSGTLTYRFDFARMLQTVVTPEFFKNISSDQITTANRNIINKFKVTYTPLYIDIKGVERRDTSLVDSTAYTTLALIDALEQYKVFFSGSQYVLSNSVAERKFLTLAPKTKKIKAGETEQLSFIYLLNDGLELNYQIYRVNGDTPSYTKSLVNCFASKYGTLTISQGVSSIIDFIDTIVKFDVWLENSTGTRISEKRTYVIDRSCGNDTRLAWANQFGAVDKYTFTAYKSKELKVTDRQFYSTPMPLLPDRSTRNEKVLSTQSEEIYTIYATIEHDDLQWFADLLVSEEVYWERSGVFIPIIILSEQQKVTDSEDLILVTIQYRLSQGKMSRNG